MKLAGFTLAVLATALLLAPEPASALRVACQRGVPPYTDMDPTNSSNCVGLFAEMFFTVARRMNLQYTLDVVATDDVDSYIRVNSTTGQSQYDMFVAFHTVNPERLRSMLFSVTIFQTDYAIALKPSFQAQRTSLEASVLRDSVLYLFSVIALISALMAIVIFVFESIAAEPTELLEQPLWQRLFWAMEQGLECTINGGSSGDMRHPVTRILRTIAGLIGLIYIVAIFGAVITAKLTTSALNNANPTVSDLRGQRLALAAPSIEEYLTSPRVGIITRHVTDIETFAIQYYAGSHGTADVGFAAPTATVEWLHETFGGASGGFIVTESFTTTGAKDLKAFPFSLGVNRTIYEEFNVQAQHMREDGELAALVAKYVPTIASTSSDDFPQPSNGVLGLTIVCCLCYGGLIIASLVLLAIDSRKGSEGEENAEEGGPVLRYRGKSYTNLGPHFEAILDAAVASAAKHGAVAGASNTDEATGEGGTGQKRRLCGMPVDGVPKDEQGDQ